MDADLIRGYKCRKCKIHTPKDEAFQINNDDLTCICIDCEQEDIEHLGTDL